MNKLELQLLFSPSDLCASRPRFPPVQLHLGFARLSAATRQLPNGPTVARLPPARLTTELLRRCTSSCCPSVLFVGRGGVGQRQWVEPKSLEAQFGLKPGLRCEATNIDTPKFCAESFSGL